jgi:hypothetical protein
MRLVVSAVRIQFGPSSSALVAASLRDGLDVRGDLCVNDATNAASAALPAGSAGVDG